MRLANVISKGVVDRELTTQEKHTAGTLVHYVFGVTTGACYGVAAESLPTITAGVGLPFGTFVHYSRRGSGACRGSIEVFERISVEDPCLRTSLTLRYGRLRN